MAAPWQDSMTPVGPPLSARPRVRQLMYAALVTGGWSALLCLLVYIVGRLVGVPFEVAPRPGEPLMVVPWFAVILVPLGAAVVLALVGALLRGLRGAGRIVLWGGTVVAAASLVAPLMQPAEVGWATRILLALMHVITWFLVVPQLARIVGDSEPGRSVDRPA
jgi:hypothetical protein